MLLGWLFACGGETTAWWMDQLEADGPCFRVDLLDGVDTTSTAELHDLFACLDQQGMLRAFEPADASLEIETRTGAPVGIELAIAIAALRRADVDPFAWGGFLLAALTAEDRPIDPLLDLSLELVYGAPAASLRDGAVDLRDPDALRAGVIAPLRSVVPLAAATLLDDDLDAATFVGGLVADAETKRWIHAVSSVIASPDPAIHDPMSRVVPDLGDLLARVRSPANDRWTNASGDSLRDVVTFFVVRDNPIVDAVAPAVDAMLGDPRVTDALVPAIDGLAAEGRLAGLPEALGWMASVDVDGTPLAPDEASALYHFVRLLADNNHPVDCAIDLGITTIDWRFDNLAVTALGWLADREPGEVVDLAGLVSDLTGNPITQDLLDLAVDSGVCPSLTAQTLDDLRALEVLQQPEAFDLLAAFVDVLHVLENGTVDHLPAFADLAQRGFEAGGYEPLEELIRDGADAPLVDDVTALVPALVHPADHGITAAGLPAPTLTDLIGIVRWSFAVDPATDAIGWSRLRPWIAPVLGHDDTWRALAAAGARMIDPGSTTRGALDLVPQFVALDPDLGLLDELGPLLADRDVAGPLLRIAERSEVVDALLADAPDPAIGEVPLSFWGRLVVNGALEGLLRLIDAVVGPAAAVASPD